MLVDGANLRGHLWRSRYQEVDADAFVAWAEQFGEARVMWFIGAYPGLEALFDHLERAGIEVITKAPKRFADGTSKADMDGEMFLAAVDAPGRYGTVVLVTGDGDFAPLVLRLRGQGVRVHVVAPLARTGFELLAAVDPEDVYDLEDELQWFGWEPQEAA